MDVRDATLEDLPAMVAIYSQAIAQGLRTGDTESFTVESRRSWFDEHDSARHPIFVARENGAEVGYATLSAYRSGRAALRGPIKPIFSDHEWVEDPVIRIFRITATSDVGQNLLASIHVLSSAVPSLPRPDLGRLTGIAILS